MRIILRRRRNSPFPTEKWYDLEHDSDLISQSIAKQYHILPSEQGELKYCDWVLMVGALMEDTPLGQIVLIRKEDNQDRLNHFSRSEHRIRNEWREFRAKQKLAGTESKAPEEFALYFEKMFARMFT